MGPIVIGPLGTARAGNGHPDQDRVSGILLKRLDDLVDANWLGEVVVNGDPNDEAILGIPSLVHDAGVLSTTDLDEHSLKLVRGLA